MLKLRGFKTLVLVIVTAATVMTAVIPVSAAAAITGKATANVLNLRASKSLVSSVIEQIPGSAKMSILDSSDSKWLKVSYNGKTGYVAKEFVKIDEVANVPETTPATIPASSVTSEKPDKVAGIGMITGTNVNIRKTASLSGDILGKLDKDQLVTLESKSGEWYLVITGSKKGYVKSEFIKTQKATGKVKADILNIRAKADTTSKKVGTALQNSSVEILGTYGDWLYIKAGSVKGYVAAEFVTITTAAVKSSSSSSNTATTSQTTVGNIFKCTAETLNVRKNAGTNYSKVATVLKGNQVTFLAVSTKDKEWYQIKTSKGVTGYVKKEFLAYHSAAPVKASTNAPSTSRSDGSQPQSTASASKADKIIATAKKYLGIRYRYGGASPSGFDCSGFTSYVFKQHGISLNRTSSDQSKNGTAVDKKNLKPGDLVLFSAPSSKSRIGHVGIYIGNGNFIHSSSGKKYAVCISNLSDAYYVKAYKTARRVLK